MEKIIIAIYKDSLTVKAHTLDLDVKVLDYSWEEGMSDIQETPEFKRIEKEFNEMDHILFM